MTLDTYRNALKELLGEGPVYRYRVGYSESDIAALEKQPGNPRKLLCHAERHVGVARSD